MKRQLDTALAAALLLCLATAGPAAAQPSAEDEPIETMADEDEDQMSMADEPENAMTGDESPADATEADGETSPDDVAGGAGEEDGAAASESRESTSEQVKGGLKRMLIGLLLPAVEREVRKAVGSDDDAQTNADVEPEAGSDP